MAWTAEILDKVIDSNRNLKITVKLSNGQTSYEMSLFTGGGQSSDWLKEQINSAIANLESLESYMTDLPIGVLDTAVTPAEPVDPVVEPEG